MAELKTRTVAASLHSKQTLQGERWILPEEYLLPSFYCRFMGVRNHGYHLFMQALDVGGEVKWF